MSYPIIHFVILSECQIRTRENRVYGGRASLRRFCLIQKERKNVVVPVIWVGPAVCPAAWCAVWRKPDGTFQVQDVVVSLSAGQGQIILPCAEKAGKKGREATLGFDFRMCVFMSAPNEKSLSVE